MPVLIAPSILTADFGNLAQQVRDAEAAGIDLWHLDVMDGHFVPPLSFGKEVIAAVRAASDDRFIEAHMMVAKPAEQFADLASAGAHRLIFHYEATGSVEASREHIQMCRELSCEAGIAINPETPVEAIAPLLRELDEVTVMLIRPGWGGQSMRSELLKKVSDLAGRVRAEGLSLLIEVDGGVKAHNARACVEAGAAVLVAGSAVFNDDEPVTDAVASLMAAIR